MPRRIHVLALISTAVLSASCAKSDQPPERNEAVAAENQATASAQPGKTREMSAEMKAQGAWGPPADLISTDGQKIGEVQTLKRSNGKWMVAVYSTLLDTPFPVGQHGLHIHAVGRCDTPDFASAGAHWNPTNKQHGHQNPSGHHLGDLGDVEVIPPMGDSGKYFAISTYPDLPTRLDPNDPGDTPVVRDADGAAIVIHADPDDEKTDPSGNSGDRIACGVIPAAQ